MKIYKISFRNRFDVLVNNIARLFFRKRFLSNIGEVFIIDKNEISDFENYNVDGVHFHNMLYNSDTTGYIGSLGDGHFDVDGEIDFNYDDTNKTVITIFINQYLNDTEIKSRYHLTYAKDIYLKICNVLRHEMEHLNQKIVGTDEGANAIVSTVDENEDMLSFLNKRLGYISSKNEIEATVKAYIFEAKKRKVDVKDLIRKHAPIFFLGYYESDARQEISKNTLVGNRIKEMIDSYVNLIINEI